MAVLIKYTKQQRKANQESKQKKVVQRTRSEIELQVQVDKVNTACKPDLDDKVQEDRLRDQGVTSSVQRNTLKTMC